MNKPTMRPGPPTLAEFEAAVHALTKEQLAALLLMDARRRETVHDCGGCARLVIAARVFPEAA